MITKTHLLPVLLLLFVLPVSAQVSFQQKSTNVGRIGLTLSNVGTIGRPQARTNVSGPPSMSYPTQGLEHLFESGFWIGAKVEGQTLVSSSAVDASSGYSTGGAGFEFSATGAPSERSKLTSSANYSSNAISHQDFVFQFTDSLTIVPGTSIPITGHTNPLNASVKLESYAWNFAFADFFVICNYEITNLSDKRWDSVWMGQWADLVVRNLNVTRDAGTAFYNKGRNGADTKHKAVYAWLADVNADDAAYIQSFGAIQFLGMEWRNLFFNPNKPDTFIKLGFQPPIVNYNFWQFNGQAPFNPPQSDIERYQKLSTRIDSILLHGTTGPTNGPPGNWIQLLSAGPIPSVAPGEKFNYVVAYVCARNSAYQVQGNAVVGSPESRKELMDHFTRAKTTYLGEDVNEDGVYRPELDANGNGKLDRYILPEPPVTPKMKIVSGDNKVDIYWDAGSIASVDPISRKQDFEGYKFYRSNIGDDGDQVLADNNNLIAQWDSTGNDIGFNNGFDAIKLPSPVFFENDPTPYVFKYSMDNLKNGWQYQFVVTAFDKGDKLLGIESLESSFTENEYRVFAGTPPKEIEENGSGQVGVYPNPYKTTAAWDGNTSRTNKIYFYNLPATCDIHIYTASGDLVAKLTHDASTYRGEDIKWFEVYGNSEKTITSGGEHAWDLLSTSKTTISTGVYIFTVRDIKTGKIDLGKFVIIK